MTNAKEIAVLLVEEARNPLHTNDILAVSPEYTACVFEAALKLAYQAGANGAECDPETFRILVNSRARHSGLD